MIKNFYYTAVKYNYQSKTSVKLNFQDGLQLFF